MILLQIFWLFIISILIIIFMRYAFSRFNDIWDFQSKSQSDGWDEDLPPIKKRSNFQSRNQSGRWDKGIFKNYLYEFYGRYFDFTGKTNRKNFWITYLLFIILFYIIFFINNDFLLIFFLLSVISPSLALVIRRLRDVGKEPEWIILIIVPFAILLILFWCTKPSNYFSRKPAKANQIDRENTGKKLEDLKNIYDKKLINEEEYNSMRRKILENF